MKRFLSFKVKGTRLLAEGSWRRARLKSHPQASRGLRARWSFALGLGCLMFLGNSSCSMQSHSPLPLGKVSRGDLIQRVTISGTVTPNRKSMITAPYSGYVKNIYVHVGQPVRQGMPIVSLVQSLRERGNDSYPMLAPFAGTVVQVLKKEGEYVDAQNASAGGNSLVRIDDLSHLFVEAAVPEVDILKLVLGQEAIIRANSIPERTFKGKIQQIAQASLEQKEWDRSRVEFPVSILVDDDSLKTEGRRLARTELSHPLPQLKPGMSVIVDIITLKLDHVLMLPHEFIQKKGSHYFVKKKTGETQPIEVGTQNEEAYEILSGLNEGDEIQQTDFLSLIQSE